MVSTAATWHSCTECTSDAYQLDCITNYVYWRSHLKEKEYDVYHANKALLIHGWLHWALLAW
jgi:hypothetical protein